MIKLKKGIQKIQRQIIEIDDFLSFSVMGDPGCDGLGAEILSIFLELLNEASETDFTLVLGDVVPFGLKHFYSNMADFMNMSSAIPVFMLRGNHDTGYYRDFFGNPDYAIADGRTLIVALDDAERKISEQTLEFLNYVLEKYPRPNIVLSMHIPPPNRVSTNSLAPGEWAKITGAFRKNKKFPAYILAGHIHSYFEDALDFEGAKLVMTGGAGARVEDVPEIQTPFYHWVKMYYDKSGKLCHERKELVAAQKGENAENRFAAPMNEMLLESFINECTAHVKYKLRSENAKRRGFENLAKLFSAVADAEFYHARNFYFSLKNPETLEEAVSESIKNERHETEEYYKEKAEYAGDSKLGLPFYAFSDTGKVERIHLDLFEKAREALNEDRDIEALQYYSCTSCGNTFWGEKHPVNCPICGAPSDKILAL
ncbi:MAG: metallophosphoesterase [Treponema sp.]|jgi:rubrerythrin|nr:metallophosphoesterase [Treponema sp.]